MSSAPVIESFDSDAPLEQAPATLWLMIFLAGFLVLSGLIVWTGLTPPFRGDLARVARLSERAFGRTTSRAPAPATAQAPVPLAEADIVVVGDSFSAGQEWQAALAADGHRVSTLNWNDTGPLCANFGSWLARHGFRGRLVIIESVERELEARLTAGAQCAAMTRLPKPLPGPSTAAPPHARPSLGGNWNESLLTGAVASWNTMRAQRAQDELVLSDWGEGDRVRLAQVAEGCARFSHRGCPQTLFLAADMERPPLDASTAERVGRWTRAQPQLDVSWMVVPNKSTVYLAPSRSAAFAERLGTLKLGPDLFDFVTRQSRELRDFYEPADTHFSHEGFQRVGELMRREVAARMALPRAGS